MAKTNVKAIAEQRAAALKAMDELLAGASAETRALTAEENEQFNSLEAEVRAIDATLQAEQRAAELMAAVQNEENAEGGSGSNDEAEVRAFENYVKKECGLPVEVRAGEQNVTMANNGAVIPTSIANKIISRVKEICPIFSGVTMFSVKGTLKVPVYGDANESHNITVGYQEEFTDITADSGRFTSVDLTGYLAGALTLIGKSVINNSEIDVLGFIVEEMSKRIARFLEKELLIGTESKAEGALSTTNVLTTASASTITADELIELQAKVPSSYQANACWTMNPAVFTAIRKLKDSTGNYLLIPSTGSIANSFPYMLLGKPVYVSDNMPTIAAGAKTVLYGEYDGLGVNMRQNIEMQVLNEAYATKHAVGLIAWFEFDSKVIDHQKLAVLVQKNG